MRVLSAILLVVCAICLFCEPAFADRRIALVIGNSAYERAPQLPNPANDATAMAEMFKKAGFDTVVLKLDRFGLGHLDNLGQLFARFANGDFHHVYIVQHPT